MFAGLVVVVASVLSSDIELRGAPTLHVRYISYEEARPLLDADTSLPQALRVGDETARRTAFDTWVRTRDEEIRKRLQRGEEDSLVPLLLFGTSFTRAPRLTRAFFDDITRRIPPGGNAAAAREQAFTPAFERRLDDFLAAMRAPGSNERLLWARATLERLGQRVDTPAARARAGQYLVENFARVTRESETIAANLGAGGSDSAALAGRAHAFASRGLAPDTSWPIEFALAEALRSLQQSGALASLQSIRRVAIVGPGLDFVDKEEGLDSYPPQSPQPFAVADELVRAGLATLDTLSLLTLDLNTRVNDHLRRAQSATTAYTIQLVLADRPWTAEAVGYWKTLGSAVGEDVAPLPPPQGAGVGATRAIRLNAGLPKHVTVIDANIVHQRLDLGVQDRVDLLVATNILLYYDTAEQALAVSNMVHLLRPSGIILTNTRLDEHGAGGGLTKLAEHLTVFSSRPGDGEVIYAYRMAARP